MKCCLGVAIGYLCRERREFSPKIQGSRPTLEEVRNFAKAAPPSRRGIFPPWYRHQKPWWGSGDLVLTAKTWRIGVPQAFSNYEIKEAVVFREDGENKIYGILIPIGFEVSDYTFLRKLLNWARAFFISLLSLGYRRPPAILGECRQVVVEIIHEYHSVPTSPSRGCEKQVSWKEACMEKIPPCQYGIGATSLPSPIPLSERRSFFPELRPRGVQGSLFGAVVAFDRN